MERVRLKLHLLAQVSVVILDQSFRVGGWAVTPLWVDPVILFGIDISRVGNETVQALDLLAQVLAIEADSSENSHQENQDGNQEHQKCAGASSVTSMLHGCCLRIQRSCWSRIGSLLIVMSCWLIKLSTSWKAYFLRFLINKWPHPKIRY